MEWVLYGGYIACAAAFLGLELAGKFGFEPNDYTVSWNLRELQKRYGWKVRVPIILGLVVLSTHLLAGVP